MNRRKFFKDTLSAAAGAFAVSSFGCGSDVSGGRSAESVSDAEFYARCQALLKRWGDALEDLQIKSGEHAGAIKCPACDFLHGRVGDAEYPFLYLAKTEGDERYIAAAKGVFDWQEKYMTLPDGAWRNDFRNSWRGTTTFRAVALAESISKFGDIIEPKHLRKMRDRLAVAAEFIYNYRWLGKPNANYVIGAAYSLAVLGHVLDCQRYRQRAAYYAQAFRRLVSPNDSLVFGEIHPLDRKSAKGLYGIDIGYNIAETLPSIEAYALLAGAAELRDYAAKIAAAHLEFMLPDGGMDNGFGTRSFKWSYWGSRTSDGCVSVLESLSDKDPRFFKAAVANLDLLEKCTVQNLLAGGLHYASHGVPPCIHHSFVQMKVLTDILTRPRRPHPAIGGVKLPCEERYGLKHFADLDTSLVSVGDWRATVTAYDSVYYPKKPQGHPSGASLSLLWHGAVGAITSSSMTEYALFEIDNMQPETDASYMTLTPRIEVVENGVNYSSDKCLKCKIESRKNGGRVEISGESELADISQNAPKSGAVKCRMLYVFAEDAVRMSFECDASAKPPRICVPIVCSSDDSYRMVSPNIAEIIRNGHTVRVSADRPLKIAATPKGRAFNHVSGFEAVPFYADSNKLEICVEVG